MSPEFIRLTKNLSEIYNILDTKSNYVREINWKFETDKNFENVNAHIEIIYNYGFTNHYYKIEKEEMEATENILNNMLEYSLHIHKFNENPEFKNKEDFLKWWLPEQFVEISINPIEMHLGYQVELDCYDHSTKFIWTGEYEKLTKLLTPLCDLYLIKLSENN